MSKLFNWFANNKTYTIIILAIIFNLGTAFGIWTLDNQIWAELDVLLGFAGMITFRNALGSYDAIKNFFDSKKTYITAGFALIFNLGCLFKLWTADNATWITINGILGSLGIAFMRKAVSVKENDIALKLNGNNS